MRARKAQASSSQSSPAISAVDRGHWSLAPASFEAREQARAAAPMPSGSMLTGGTSSVSAKLRVPQTLRPPSESESPFVSSHLVTARNYSYSYSFAPSAASIPPPPPIAIALSCCTIVFGANMLSSTSRTALRRAANNKFTVKAGVRAVSAWSSVPQGPPVSQLLVLPWWLGPANVLAGCK